MPADYPDEIASIPVDVEDRDEMDTGEPNTDPKKGTVKEGSGFHADLHNEANAEIIAIQATLGVNPQGGENTVAERISAVEEGGSEGPAGPEGPKGDDGDEGPQGIQGAKGDTGSAGATGPEGPAGEDASALPDLSLSGAAGARWRMGPDKWMLEEFPVAIGWQGDSIPYGTGSGDKAEYFTNAAPARLQVLVDKWLGGDHIEFVPVDSVADDARLSKTGTWAGASFGPHRGALRCAGNAHTFSIAAEATHFIVYYVDEANGGTLMGAIDAGEFSSAGSTNLAPSVVKHAVFAVGSLKSAKLTVKPNEGAKPLTLVGFGVLDNTPKAGSTSGSKANRVFRMASPGTKIDAILGEANEADALASGFLLPGRGRTGNPGADLNIISFLTNDYLQQTVVATYKSRLETAVTKALTSGSVLLVAPMKPDEAKTIPWEDYRDTMREVAEAKGCAFLDLDAPWGAVGTAVRDAMDSDFAHPAERGHYDMALRVFEAIHAPLYPVPAK